MVWITRKRVCSNCGGTELTRYHRSFWMRLFPRSQYLRCRQCRSTILLLPGDESAGDAALPDDRGTGDGG
jgi:DNA-directed RNA polymerase subunit RPC12/RpoP